MGQKHSQSNHSNGNGKKKSKDSHHSDHSHSNAPKEIVGENKKPQLVRMDSDGIPKKCAICLEEQIKGLCCEANHFICGECFSPYVDNLCTDFGKLRESKFEVCCPVPGCKSPPWNSHHARKGLEGQALEKYIDTLIQICNRNSAGVGIGGAVGMNNGDQSQRARFLAILSDALCLKCPSCNVVLDPNPDGCCSIKCLGCAQHFCWLCFTTQRNSTECHAHVRKCSLNNKPGEVFLSRECCRNAHKVIRSTELRSALTKIWFKLNPNELECPIEKLKTSPEIKELLQEFRHELDDCQLTPHDIFAEKPVAKIRPALGGNDTNRVLITSIIVATGMFVVSKFSPQSIFNLCLSLWAETIVVIAGILAVRARWQRDERNKFVFVCALYLAKQCLFSSISSTIWYILAWWEEVLLITSALQWVQSNGRRKESISLCMVSLFYFRSLTWMVVVFVFDLVTRITAFLLLLAILCAIVYKLG